MTGDRLRAIALSRYTHIENRPRSDNGTYYRYQSNITQLVVPKYSVVVQVINKFDCVSSIRIIKMTKLLM